jgi:nitrite reductase/ring-hydroxylating ferredoxin subunit
LGEKQALLRHVLCRDDELQPNEMRCFPLGDRTVIVCRSDNGAYFAIANRCPHQGAQLCAGSMGGTTLQSQPGQYLYGREGEILRCPWHGFEFDVTTGLSLHGEPKLRVKSYRTIVENGAVTIVRDQE